MRSLFRRVERIEEKLNIGDDRTGVCIILIGKRDADALPDPLEEWITYKQEKAKCGVKGTVHIAMLSLEEELKAREEQKATLQKETIL
jgi:hypothetical protein